jgi:hypothetical protein
MINKKDIELYDNSNMFEVLKISAIRLSMYNRKFCSSKWKLFKH